MKRLTECPVCLYTKDMFVSVACDLSNDDTRKNVAQLLVQYGFKAVLGNVFESAAISEKTLLRLKRDIDRFTDSYDIIRFYQFPMEGTLVLSALKKKKWLKTVIRS